MTRHNWQELAQRWLDDAKTLLRNKRSPAAYYVAGYAVECGLKACILKRVADMPEVIFGDRKFSERCWTHNISELVKLADLEAARKADADNDPDLSKNWLIVKDWSELARYQTITHKRAKKLLKAITTKESGVMQWIKKHW